MATELRTLASNHEATRDEEEHEEANALIQYLPSPDRGLAAWKFLAGAFIIEALFWGKSDF
jgi:hypothetical protein